MKPEDGTTYVNTNTDVERYKQALADAVHHAVNLLKEEGVISKTVSNALSSASKEIGREILKRVKDIAEEVELVEDEEVMGHMDSDLEDDFEEVADPLPPEDDETMSSSAGSDQEYNCENHKEDESDPDPSLDRVSWKTKVKAVKMAKLHPKWSLETIRSKTTRYLTTMDQLRKWKLEVERNGSNSLDIINEWTYRRFLGARSRKRLVTSKMLQQWATEKSEDFISPDFKFIASKAWVDRFKRDRMILQRRIIRFVNKGDPPMLEVMLP